MAPELISRDFEAISCKSDVYNIGMVLLELASRRRNVDVDAISSSKLHLPSWLYGLNEGGDSELQNLTKSDATIARKWILHNWVMVHSNQGIGSFLHDQSPGNVTRGHDDLEIPPKPVFFSPQYLCETEPESDSPKEMLIPESMERSSK